MEHAVMWAAVGVGIGGWLVAVAALGPLSKWRAVAAPQGWTPFVIAALALVAGVFLLSLREKMPFAAGQGWGRGWAVGGVAALGGALAGGVFASVVKRDPLSAAMRIAGGLWPVIAALGLVSLRERGALLDALCGALSGHVAVSLLLSAGALRSGRRESVLLLSSASAFATALGTAILLGTFRDFRAADLPRGTWEAVALGLGIVVAFLPPLGALLQSALPRREGRYDAWHAPVVGWGVAALLMVGVARLLSGKLVDESGLVLSVAIGLAAGLAAWWSARDEQWSTGVVAPFAIAATLGGLTAAFVALQGVGSALMLLAWWPALNIALAQSLTDDGATSNAPKSASPEVASFVEGAPFADATSFADAAPQRFALPAALVQIASFGAVVVLYRAVQTRFRADLRGVAITDQYALWGFVAGAIAPSLLAGLSARDTGEPSGGAPSTRTAAVLLRNGLAGLLCVALPVAATLFFGPKCALALVFGLALGCLLRPARERPELGALMAVWALFGALLIAQWTHRWLPLAELTRGGKLRVLAALLAVAVVVWLLSELSARFTRRDTTGAVRASPPAPPVESAA